jgi:hypothetical protein
MAAQLANSRIAANAAVRYATQGKPREKPNIKQTAPRWRRKMLRVTKRYLIPDLFMLGGYESTRSMSLMRRGVPCLELSGQALERTSASIIFPNRTFKSVAKPQLTNSNLPTETFIRAWRRGCRVGRAQRRLSRRRCPWSLLSTAGRPMPSRVFVTAFRSGLSEKGQVDS